MDGDSFGTTFLVVWGGAASIIVGGLLIAIVGGLVRWSRNNRSPVVTVPAVVIAKRGHVSGGSGDSSSSTSYHVTFEIRGGERLEFGVRGREYGVLAEHDKGQLTHQGTRYKGFARTPVDR